MLKFYVILGLLITSPLMAEVVCRPSENGMEICQVQETSDPTQCETDPDPILQHTGLANEPLVCNNQTLVDAGKSKKELADERKQYEKLCKQKAKSYKKNLMKQLFRKGKVGQWMQVLFKKKKYRTKVSGVDYKNKKQTINMDADKLQGMTPQQVEDYILNELATSMGMKNADEFKKQIEAASQDPSFQYSYDRPETVPLNLMVKTNRGTMCKVETEELPKETPFIPKDCKFCEEKNINSSFTNDCSFMVNKDHPESEARELVGVKKREDFCNHDMKGVENDLGPVDSMADTLCEMAQDGVMKPDFTIETSRNLYNDKTPQLAKKRGEYIQKYLYKNLKEKCFGGNLEDAPDWLKDEEEFRSSVKVTHPYYEGAVEGDYGPSPYAKAGPEQEKNIKNLEITLTKEKNDLVKKNSTALELKTKYADDLTKMDQDIVRLSNEYKKISKEISSLKAIDDKLFERKQALEHLYNEISTIQDQKNVVKQKMLDLDKEISGYTKKLSTIDQDNSQKVSLLKEYYQEMNEKGSVDKEAWDKKLFDDFKMVRITGKAVDDYDTLIPPQYLTPKLKIALDVMVDMQNFTCVVEPIPTRKTSLEGILKGTGKVLMAITLPVTGAIGLGVGLATSPISWAASYMCSGCGDPGNVPPVLTFNPRFWSLKEPFQKETWRKIGEGVNNYISLGGKLDVGMTKNKNKFENSLEDVRAEELRRQKEKEDKKNNKKK